MKVLSFVLFSILVSSSAFATHAYRSESCKSATLKLEYTGNYPIGGGYNITRLGIEEATSALPREEEEHVNTLSDAEVIFEQVSSKLVSEKTSTRDCDFDHEEWVSQKIVKIDAISKKASKKLGLKKGSKIQFVCEESFDTPNGKDC